MTKSIGIHIFRKDLRIVDNLALNELSKKVDTIIPIFILDPKQIKKNSANKNYFSPRAARFILDCLIELNTLCSNNLCILQGVPSMVLPSFLKQVNPKCVSFNADYTEYALARDSQIVSMCDKLGIKCVINYDDQSLVPMDNLIKKDSTPYMVFGAFYKNAIEYDVTTSTKKITFSKSPVTGLSIRDKFIQSEYSEIENHFHGGRSYGLANMRNKQSINGFHHRDILINHSFEISPYLNFGCISIREVYSYFNKNKINADRELYWRDFFLCILRYRPNATSYTTPMDSAFNKIKWRSVSTKQSKDEWYKFLECSTGYLLIDAGMKQLQQTGYIGNRMRLLLATFWTKYLMINPLDSEYGSQTGYSRMLTDCSTSQNKLNSQWITSELDLSGRRFAKKGCNAISGRMIRIDNSMISKYDPTLEYISKWLPEWRGKTKKDIKQVNTIFDWSERYQEYCQRCK